MRQALRLVAGRWTVTGVLAALLLAVVAGVLAAFASFFIYLARRAKTFAQEN